MRRLVVTTESGEKVVAIDVEMQELVDKVLGYLRVLPTASFYVDGQLVSQEDLEAVKAAAAAAAASTTTAAASAAATPSMAATAAPSPERVKDYNETLQQAFDDVRRAQVQTMRDMGECTRMVMQVLIEQQRQFADEAARQREITRKSLDDVDLLGRCVKATQFNNNVLAVAGTGDPLSRRGGGITFHDLWVGIQRTFLGEQ